MSETIKIVDEADDKFPDLPGSVVLIKRKYNTALLCYFTTCEEAFEFGHAFLRQHTSELRAERPGINSYIEWTDAGGALWLADYKSGSVLSAIKSDGWGRIGTASQFYLDLYIGLGIPVEIWLDTDCVHVVPAGLAMMLGKFGRVSNDSLDVSIDKRVSHYMLSWTRTWQDEMTLGI
jgi:hypothetical protein